MSNPYATRPAKRASLTQRRRQKTQAAATVLAGDADARALMLDCLMSDTPARLALVTRLAMRAEGPQSERERVRAWLWAFADDPQRGVYQMARTALQTLFDVSVEELERTEEQP